MPADKIFFHFSRPLRALQQRKRLKVFLSVLLKKEGVSLSRIDYVFCSDKELLKINRDFLNHDFFTDIISFPLSDPGESLLGEIYISVDRVRENAILYKSGLVSELHRVIFHGALHFCGYKDKTRGQKNRMRSMEDKYLKAYFRKSST